MKRQAKAILSVVPVVGRYIAQKEALAAAWKEALAECAALRWERDTALGKLSILQADHSALRRDLTRLPKAARSLIDEQSLRDLYVGLLACSLIGMTIRDGAIDPERPGFDESRRELGRDWPASALTMIGKARICNLRHLVETALSEDVPGDFLEAGVWRGGACIFMRGILKAYGITDRSVWAADSFAGHPLPDPEQYPADKRDLHHTYTPLAVPLEQVRANFSSYDLLDKQVHFLKGWFKDTLPRAPIQRLALLRLDGDMYESTIQTLDAMYWKLSPRGFVIVDDYFLPACKKAVEDFRALHAIESEIEEVDGAAVYWRKLPHEQPAQQSLAPRRAAGARS
jgi:hypothetical protein